MDRPLFIAGQRREKQPDGWGTPMPLLHRSITEIKEQEFVATLVSNPRHRDMLFNLKGLDGDTSRILQSVELREFRPELQGDVDILLAPHGAPERSTAIQVKRLHVKVGLDEADAGHKQRMSQLVAKGVRQANLNAIVGFSQVYLWVFVLIDTRAQNDGRLTYDGPDSGLRSRIEQALTNHERLDRRVGYINFDWVQPMDSPPLQIGTSGLHLRNLATPVAQPAELTEWISTLRD